MTVVTTTTATVDMSTFKAWFNDMALNDFKAPVIQQWGTPAPHHLWGAPYVAQGGQLISVATNDTHYAPVPDHVPTKWVEEVDAARAAEMAFEAASNVEERGWWQGGYVGPGGKVCAMGALMEAGVRGEYHAAIEREAISVVGDHVPNWNDQPGRTAEEVISMWLDVAARFEARAK